MNTPPILYTGPAISPDVPWEIARHLQTLYQTFGNHTQAFSLLAGKIGAAGNTTNNIVENITTGGGGGGGGGSTSPIGQVNDQSGVTAYTTMTGDNGGVIIVSDASAIAISLTSETPPWACFITNQGIGTATLTPVGGTISYAGNPGAANFPLLGSYSCLVAFDGTNWWVWAEPISTAVEFETDGTPNSTQSLLNLVAGANVTLTEVAGSVTIAATGSGGGGSNLLTTWGAQTPVTGNGSFQTLLSYTIPGGTLAAGKGLVFRFFTQGLLTSGASNMYKVVFGATSLGWDTPSSSRPSVQSEVTVFNDPGSTTSQTVVIAPMAYDVGVPAAVVAAAGTIAAENMGANVTIELQWSAPLSEEVKVLQAYVATI